MKFIIILKEVSSDKLIRTFSNVLNIEKSLLPDKILIKCGMVNHIIGIRDGEYMSIIEDRES